MSASVSSRTASRPAFQRSPVIVIEGSSGSPAARRMALAAALSIEAAEERQPEPTKGASASSKRPWRVPSSPWEPWMMGKKTSTPAGSPPSAETRRASPGVGGKYTSRPSEGVEQGSGSSSHLPSGVTRMGIASWRPGSRWAMIARPEARLTSCSDERPPNSTPTRILRP